MDISVESVNEALLDELRDAMQRIVHLRAAVKVLQLENAALRASQLQPLPPPPEVP